MKYYPNTSEVDWSDFKYYIEINTPQDFSFEQCLVYLDRSNLEILHKVKNNNLFKLVKFDDCKILLNIHTRNNRFKVSFMNVIPPKCIRAQISKFVWDLFDLSTELTPFYELAKHDSIIESLVTRYKGLRVIKINDLFEGLCWAIIGQQINLKFAYTLKKRFVENFGEKLIYDGEDYYLFPLPQDILQLNVEDLKALQFTTRKAEYIIGIAQLIADGIINQEALTLEKDYEVILKKLVSIRGVGNWTADYVIMKCFNLNCAFPIADVGIHNALKGLLNLDEKPQISDIKKLSQNWGGWEAYAAFYLWRCLYD